MRQTGLVVGKDVYACAGVFSPGNAARLCADGYHICNDGSSVNPALCGSQGFFVTKTIARKKKDQGRAPECQPPGEEDTTLIVGCGQHAGVIDLDPACGGLKQALNCDQTRLFPCNGGYDKDNGESSSGVLCCHD